MVKAAEKMSANLIYRYGLAEMYMYREMVAMHMVTLNAEAYVNQ